MEPSLTETCTLGRLTGMQTRRCLLGWLLVWAIAIAGPMAGAAPAVDDRVEGRTATASSRVGWSQTIISGFRREPAR